MQNLTLEAASPASLARQLVELDHETRANVTATYNGEPWARLDIKPTTDTARSIFPTGPTGVRGDTRKRGQSGVMIQGTDTAAILTVINRARKMHPTI